MAATPLLDATPLATDHSVRGIGAAVGGMLDGFRALPAAERPALVLTHAQAAPAGFRHARVRWPHWPLSRLRLPDPWPAAIGERRLRRGAGTAVIHATQPALIPAGPTVATCYDLIPAAFADEYLAGPGRAAEAAAHRRHLARLRSATLVVAISHETAGDLARLGGVDRGRIRVVPLAAPTPVAPDGPPLGGDYVLYSGSLEPHKNVPLLLDAVAALPDAKPRVRLVLTGAWSPRRLERLKAHARSVGAAGRVDWLGWVDAGRLTAIRAGALAVAVPSRKEGFGLPVLEAMAAGVPVLASDTPAMNEVGGEAARHLAVDDAQAWADAITRLADDEAERRRLIDAGRGRAQAFTWRATAEALRDIYAEAAEAGA